MAIPGQLARSRLPVEATTTPPIRYHDAEYQKAHDDLFTAGTKQPIKQVLPTGVSQSDFDAVIATLVQSIGKDGVFTGEGLREYIDPYATSAEKAMIPCAAVCPRDIEQLRQVLRSAESTAFQSGPSVVARISGTAARLQWSLALLHWISTAWTGYSR